MLPLAKIDFFTASERNRMQWAESPVCVVLLIEVIFISIYINAINLE